MKRRTTDHLYTIYTVDLMAVITALYWIEESNYIFRFQFSVYFN